MKRLAGVFVLLVLAAGCRESRTPGLDQQVRDIEATLAAIESEMAGD